MPELRAARATQQRAQAQAQAQAQRQRGLTRSHGIKVYNYTCELVDMWTCGHVNLWTCGLVDLAAGSAVRPRPRSAQGRAGQHGKAAEQHAQRRARQGKARQGKAQQGSRAARAAQGKRDRERRASAKHPRGIRIRKTNGDRVTGSGAAIKKQYGERRSILCYVSLLFD